MGMLFYHYHVCLPQWMIYAALLLLPFRGNGSTHELLAILGLAQRGDADGEAC